MTSFSFTTSLPGMLVVRLRIDSGRKCQVLFSEAFYTWRNSGWQDACIPYKIWSLNVPTSLVSTEVVLLGNSTELCFQKTMVQDFLWEFRSQLITCMKRSMLAFIQFSLTVAVVFCRHFRSTCMWCLLSTFLFVCIFAYLYEVLCTFKNNSFIVHIWTRNSFFLTSPQNCHSIISFWT